MRHIVDPRQGRLFDPFDGVIPPLGRKWISEGWQGLFRHVLLQVMPAAKLGKHFHPIMGCPTKELHSVAGLLFLQELNGWTNIQAVEAYVFHTDVQYALNLEPGRDEMCERTLERYRALAVEDGLASEIMDRITTELYCSRRWMTQIGVAKNSVVGEAIGGQFIDEERKQPEESQGCVPFLLPTT